MADIIESSSYSIVSNPTAEIVSEDSVNSNPMSTLTSSNTCHSNQRFQLHRKNTIRPEVRVSRRNSCNSMLFLTFLIV